MILRQNYTNMKQSYDIGMGKNEARVHKFFKKSKSPHQKCDMKFHTGDPHF
jgi:hypothetical protein